MGLMWVLPDDAQGVADLRVGYALGEPRFAAAFALGSADQVTGPVSSAARVANDLGRWLSVLVLIGAFAVARRVREFGTLKAIGWRAWRIVAQVPGESVTGGLLAGALGSWRIARSGRSTGPRSFSR
jgi:hypothetical protein